jgi:glycogen debranching enzyme
MAYSYEQMMNDEWLEADGLGGFASGTVSGIRTRRYHALLLTATRPPAGRLVLVNGFGAAVETTNGNFALSSQHYPPDIMHPDGARRIVDSPSSPGPRGSLLSKMAGESNRKSSPSTAHRSSF